MYVNISKEKVNKQPQWLGEYKRERASTWKKGNRLVSKAVVILSESRQSLRSFANPWEGFFGNRHANEEYIDRRTSIWEAMDRVARPDIGLNVQGGRGHRCDALFFLSRNCIPGRFFKCSFGRPWGINGISTSLFALTIIFEYPPINESNCVVLVSLSHIPRPEYAEASDRPRTE